MGKPLGCDAEISLGCDAGRVSSDMTRALGCDARCVFCVAGVALGAMDGPLVWHVLCICGLASFSYVFCAPFSVGCASVLLSLSGAPVCPLSGPNPSKRTSPALPLLVCLSVLLALSGGPFLATEPPEILHSGLPQLFSCFCAPFSVGFCAPFSLWCSVWAADPTPPPHPNSEP